MSTKRNRDLMMPPHSADSEQAVLGGLMLNEKALLQISDWLTDDHFYLEKHRLIYRAICDLAAKGQPHDAVTLGEWFHAQGVSEQVGGASYVIELVNTTASAANITAYAEIVREKARLRDLVDRGTALASAAMAPRADASLLASEAMSALAAVTTDPQRGGLRPVRAAMSSWYAQLQQRFDSDETMTGLETPWECVNDCTMGWQRGDLIVFAGRTSMGKSVLGFQAAVFNGLRGNRTDIFSLEMREDQVIQRSVAAVGRVPHEHLRKPKQMFEADWPLVSDAGAKISAAPILIDDQSGLTVQQIVARAKRQHMRSPTSLIVVDHLHEIRRPGKDPVGELGMIARELKTLAKTLMVPVILLAQLNRSNDSAKDRRPTNASLRASGEIEEVADVIFLIHREDYYDRKTHLKGVIELIIGKGRDLPIGETLYLKNRFDEMRAVDWEGPLPTAKSVKDSDDDSSQRTLADDLERANRKKAA